jgi:CRP/FNR family transcriptional regulator, nitrogen fixation regulation protein
MQTTVQKTRSVLQRMKSHPVTPDALDLLEQFGITVAAQRGHEIYGQSEPTEFCWRIVSGCVRTEKYLEDGRRQVGAFLWPGNLVGMDDLGMHDFGAQAVTDVTLRRYPRRMVEALAQSHTALAHRLRALAESNLRRAYQQIMMPSRPAAPSPSAAEPPHDGDVMALAKIRALGHSAGAR